MAFLLSLVLTPAARALSFRVGAVDIPRDARRMHKKPTARMGGAAIVVSFFASCLLCFTDGGAFPKECLPVFIGGAMIAMLGAVDDIRALKPMVKLAGQITAVLFTAYAGVRIDFIGTPSGIIRLGIFSVPVTVLWMLVIINAFNLIDGIDGLAAGTAALSAAALAGVSVSCGSCVCAVLCFCLFGAALGFLPYNSNPASVFMGDTGSMFLGYILSCASVMGLAKSHMLVSIGVPLLIFAVPVFDTALAMIRRAVKRENIFSPDRGHIHHRLVIALGFSQKKATLTLCLVTAVYCISAAVMSMNLPLGALIASLATAYMISIFFLSGKSA